VLLERRKGEKKRGRERGASPSTQHFLLHRRTGLRGERKGKKKKKRGSRSPTMVSILENTG